MGKEAKSLPITKRTKENIIHMAPYNILVVGTLQKNKEAHSRIDSYQPHRSAVIK